MQIKTAIQKAIEGGWEPKEKGLIKHEQILLDPKFWQALGKSEGWKKVVDKDLFFSPAPKEKVMLEGWMFNQLQFIKNIQQDQDIETAFDNATK